MKFLSPIPAPRLVLLFCLIVLALQGAFAQKHSSAPDRAAAAILRVRVLQDKDSPGIEITSSQPISPVINKLDGPPRIVIDLPDTRMSVASKQFPVRSDRINAVRLNQFQKSPPVVRVVFDLLEGSDYSSETLGNVLTVRLHAPAPLNPPATPAFVQGVQPTNTGNSPTSAAVVFAGQALTPGSSVTAGSDTAVLRLGRGGEVRVCPGTSVSVTPSSAGREMMLGMSTGTLEAHYSIGAFSDVLLTPDFRMVMTGPGEFDYAFNADAHGNTCVRALPGNSASVIVQELMGDGSYQVKPNEQVVFHSGHLNQIDSNPPPTCGCPEPPEPVMRASSNEAAPDTNQAVTMLQPPALGPANPTPPAPAAAIPSLPGQVKVSMSRSDTAAVPNAKKNDLHVQVEAPFVFRATDTQPEPPQPAPVEEAGTLPLTFSQPPAPLQTVEVAPPPPPTAKPTPHHGFFGKVKGFFSAIFH